MVAHNCHGKTKNLTAKTKYHTAKLKTSRQKQNTSQQNQILHSRNQISHGKSKYSRQKPKLFWFCCEVFGFAVRFLVLQWGILFSARFLVLPWGILFLPWGFWFCRDSCGPPYCKILRFPIRVIYPWKVLSQIVLKNYPRVGRRKSWQLENVEFEKRAITTLMTHWCGISISRGDSWPIAVQWFLCICDWWPSRCEAVVFTGNLSQHNPILPASWHQVLVFPF